MIVALSVWGVVVPNRLIALVTGLMNRGSGLYVRIGSRVVLGVALIVAAPPARFPILFAVLGWISIAAAIALPLFGRARLGALLGWLERMPTTLVRLWLVYGVVFGAFLLYGV